MHPSPMVMEDAELMRTPFMTSTLLPMVMRPSISPILIDEMFVR